jgi:rhodanese-related sulfurtransferase
MTGHRFTRRIAALSLAAVLGLAACGGDTVVFELTDAAESQELLSEPPAGLVVLDIRTPEEYAEGHLAGSSNLDFYEPDFADSLDALDKDLPYFVYCRSGNRSSTAIETMKDLGFTEVYELDGGIVTWAEAGLPIEQ